MLRKFQPRPNESTDPVVGAKLRIRYREQREALAPQRGKLVGHVRDAHDDARRTTIGRASFLVSAALALVPGVIKNFLEESRGCSGLYPPGGFPFPTLPAECGRELRDVLRDAIEAGDAACARSRATQAACTPESVAERESDYRRCEAALTAIDEISAWYDEQIARLDALDRERDQALDARVDAVDAAVRQDLEVAENA